VLAAVLLIAASAQAAGALTQASVRAFVARQERAWNAKDLEGYFAGFTRDAVFIDQTRTPKGETIRYGTSDLAKAKAFSRRYFAKARFTDSGVVDNIVISPDGRSARVLGRKTTRLEMDGRRQTLCARTDQTLVLIAGQPRSRGQTDTTLRCQDARR
jgi:hypothetical protein